MDTCRAPSALAQYRVLLMKDLRQEFRTKEMLVSMGIYALLVIVVFGVALSFARPGADFLEVSGGLLWALVVFTSLLGLNRSFSHETENGCLEGLLLAPLDRGVVFLAKATSNLVFLGIVEIIAVPLYWVFFSSFAAPAATAALIVVPLVLGSVGIAGIGTLLSTITAATRGKDVMLALLFVPIVFPLLYACVSATTAALVGGVLMEEAFATSLALAAGYDVIMLLASWVLYDFVVS
ncbi:heme exporter protein CcmB [Enterorhabdus sp. P55]|uniref:heme exporter protein CcmB n=1 Tax=Enterorhabdus sp. P55 TaxID=2304571 RepID=UPI00136CE270|nr:heme exporter protein CcmB [Enterorhabdus sp. P55]NBI32081.1 heme ABC transporter permease CcmB [Enterorhabdus sp. P55]